MSQSSAHVATSPTKTFLRKAERVAARNTLILDAAHKCGHNVDVVPTDKQGWAVEYERIIALVNAKCGRTGQENAYRASSVKALHSTIVGYYATTAAVQNVPVPQSADSVTNTDTMHTARRAYTAYRKAHGMVTNNRAAGFRALKASEKRDALADYRENATTVTVAESSAIALNLAATLPAGTTFKVNADGTFTVC
jgi:hypothetical protein